MTVTDSLVEKTPQEEHKKELAESFTLDCLDFLEEDFESPSEASVASHISEPSPATQALEYSSKDEPQDDEELAYSSEEGTENECHNTEEVEVVLT